MEFNLFETKEEMGSAAARAAAQVIDSAIWKAQEANIVLATGEMSTLPNPRQDSCRRRHSSFAAPNRCHQVSLSTNRCSHPAWNQR